MELNAENKVYLLYDAGFLLGVYRDKMSAHKAAYLIQEQHPDGYDDLSVEARKVLE